MERLDHYQTFFLLNLASLAFFARDLHSSLARI